MPSPAEVLRNAQGYAAYIAACIEDGHLAHAYDTWTARLGYCRDTREPYPSGQELHAACQKLVADSEVVLELLRAASAYTQEIKQRSELHDFCGARLDDLAEAAEAYGSQSALPARLPAQESHD